MSSLDPQARENSIDLLVSQLLDTGLSEEQRAALLMQLQGDAESCDLLVEHFMLHAALRREIGSHRPATLSESLFSEPTPLVLLPIVADTGHPLAAPSESPPALGFFTFGALGWTLFTALLAAVAVTFWVQGGWQNPGADGAGRVAESKPFPVSSVRLDSGTANLALPGVGHVIVEGPAEFELVEPLRARLNRGRIKMRVTEKSGHGFTVETPFGNVMDLGTEFGLDVSEKGQAGVVVFDGAVNLQVAESSDKPDFSRTEHLERGDGVTFREGGKLDRIMSIVTGSAATFQQRTDERAGSKSVILDVSDNRRTTETKKFYEIVPGGLREDVQAYVDRPQHDWNGVTSDGLPSYLVGADYVKPFNDDKVQKNIEINVTLSCPAKLYVFFDDRLPTPAWLKKVFRKTSDKIGLDVGDWAGSKRHFIRADGPGVSIDAQFSIWVRTVKEPSTVTLGPNAFDPINTSSGMYGIAAVALETEKETQQN
jgi:hypothetical protein